MNIETMIGLLGFTMYIAPLTLANLMIIQRITDFIETKIPEKYREYVLGVVCMLWVLLGVALMAVGA